MSNKNPKRQVTLGYWQRYGSKDEPLNPSWTGFIFVLIIFIYLHLLNKDGIKVRKACRKEEGRRHGW